MGRSIRLFGGFVAAVLLIAAAAFLSWRNTAELAQTQQLVTHTHEILEKISALLLSIDDIENNQRAFLLTGNEALLAPVASSKKALRENVLSLRSLVSDNPAQQ